MVAEQRLLGKRLGGTCRLRPSCRRPQPALQACQCAVIAICLVLRPARESLQAVRWAATELTDYVSCPCTQQRGTVPLVLSAAWSSLAGCVHSRCNA